MKKLLLCLIFFVLVLSACVGAVDNDIPPPEAPPEPITIGGEAPMVSEQMPEPEPEPEPSQFSPENWPAHFAALVEASSHLVDVVGFHLMDTTFDGTPKLLVELRLPMGIGPHLIALSWDSPLEAISNPEMILSGLPLRFFRSDETGEVIFSSLIASYGNLSILYQFSEDLTRFREVRCSGANNHALWRPTEDGGEVIEEFIATPGLQDLVVCSCDIYFGRNSTDPTIVYLVNLALEGFTEISAPHIYTFRDLGRQTDYGTFFTPEDVEAIQAWIFEVAESWGG